MASTAAAGHPVARLIDSVLADAVRKRASDIHFEPEGRQLRIRLRIDGVLWVVRSLNARHWPAVSARLKQMASMTVDDHQTPQQGRFSYALGTRALEVRVSSLPTVDGENVVLRLLDR
ncbi:MAG: ATPase, T2SS/T4P/T4SS family, partial [Rhodospirillaceae bacterium]